MQENVRNVECSIIKIATRSMNQIARGEHRLEQEQAISKIITQRKTLHSSKRRKLPIILPTVLSLKTWITFEPFEDRKISIN